MAELESFNFTHNGNGDRFAQEYGGQVLLSAKGHQRDFYSSRVDGRWYLNEGAHAGDIQRRGRDLIRKMEARAKVLALEAEACEDERTAATAAALAKWAHQCDNPAGLTQMAEMACLSYGMVTDADEKFDNRLDIITTPSQVLELGADGVVVRALDSLDMVTLSTSVEYRPEMLEAAMPPLLQEYFDTFIPDEKKRGLIFKALGSAVLGGNPGRLLLMMIGKGTTGKTQLVEAIRAAMGSYGGVGNPSMFRGNLDDKPRPDVISVLKKRMVFLAEASKNWELHGDRVKAITGGDAIKVRRMRADDFLEVVPHFTPVFYANEMPRVSGADQPLKRRMLVVDFNLQPAVEDPTIKQKFLADESVREYLFAMLVQGCVDAMRDGLEDVKDEFAALTVKSFDQTTHLGEFMEWLGDGGQLRVLDAVELEEYGAKSKSVLVKAMHERYIYWIQAHGNKQDKNDGLNYKEFNAHLRENYGWESQNINGGLRWVGKRLTEFVHTAQN